MLDFDLSMRRQGFRLQAAASLPSQGIIGLIGTSGHGKTTLLRALSGLEQGCQGHVQLDDRLWFDSASEVNLPVHERAVGYVFQHPSLFPHLNVAANLDYAWQRVPEHSRRLSVQRAIELLAIRHLLARDTRSLSGGESQRVAIARALCANPALLLLDEPLVSVDSAGRQEILSLLEALRDELSMPMIYVSHTLSEVAQLSDHLMLLENGSLTAHGPAHEMLTRLDLPLAHVPDAEALLTASVVSYDETNEISRLRASCGDLFVTQKILPDTTCRLRILARDVSVALTHATDSSILNILPASIVAITGDRPGQRLLQLQVGDSIILARLSLQSAERLSLQVGMQVFAQIKSVALV